MNRNLDSAENQLVELNANLSDVDVTVAKLKERLSQYTKEAAEVEIGLNEVRDTLGSAETLVYKLEDEFKRWQEQVRSYILAYFCTLYPYVLQLQQLSNELDILPKDSLLAAAFITFLSEEEESRRRYRLRLF